RIFSGFALFMGFLLFVGWREIDALRQCSLWVTLDLGAFDAEVTPNPAQCK
ncbi:unnamed protein product, partial [Effrenium voratum]